MSDVCPCTNEATPDRVPLFLCGLRSNARSEADVSEGHPHSSAYQKPLSMKLSYWLDLSLVQQSDLQIRLGLYDVINALKFLHEVGNVAHNNVCQSAVHVAASGTLRS